MAKNKLRIARRQTANVDAIINGGISRANSVVSSYLVNGVAVDFERESRNEVSFYASDPVTGMSAVGSYIVNNSGVVTEYGFSIYASPADNESFFFAYMELDGGGSSFLAHAQALAANSGSQVFYDAGFTGNAQPVANFLDAMPGANRYDPFSTGVSILGGEFAFA